MKPYVLSQKMQQTNKGWSQQGENIQFDQRKYKYVFLDEYTQSYKTPYCLQFEYVCTLSDDVVSFAYCPPYTYSKLLQTVSEIMQTQSLRGQNYVQEEKLCQSLSGADLPLLTITGKIARSRSERVCGN